MALLGLDFVNVYQNLTNIVLTITPKAHLNVPAVLVNGHYDSAIGSPGAAASLETQHNCICCCFL